MNRGEVWWVEHPGGRRPALILTRERALPVLRSVTVVPATTTIRGIAVEIPLDEDDGMPIPCVLNFDDIQTIPMALCTERICTLDVSRLHEVCRTLAFTLGCSKD